MMQHLRDYFINPLVYESTDAETELLKIDWKHLMKGDGTSITRQASTKCGPSSS